MNLIISFTEIISSIGAVLIFKLFFHSAAQLNFIDFPLSKVVSSFGNWKILA